MTSEFLIVKFISQDTDSERTLKLPIVSKQGTKKIIAQNDTYGYEGGYNKAMEANGPDSYLSFKYPRGDGSFKPSLAGTFKNGYLVKACPSELQTKIMKGFDQFRKHNFGDVRMQQTYHVESFNETRYIISRGLRVQAFYLHTFSLAALACGASSFQGKTLGSWEQ